MHAGESQLTDLEAALLDAFLDGSAPVPEIARTFEISITDLHDTLAAPRVQAVLDALDSLTQLRCDIISSDARCTALQALEQIAADPAAHTIERRRAAAAILRPFPLPSPNGHATSNAHANPSPEHSPQDTRDESPLPLPPGEGPGEDPSPSPPQPNRTESPLPLPLQVNRAEDPPHPHAPLPPETHEPAGNTIPDKPTPTHQSPGITIPGPSATPRAPSTLAQRAGQATPAPYDTS